MTATQESEARGVWLWSADGKLLMQMSMDLPVYNHVAFNKLLGEYEPKQKKEGKKSGQGIRMKCDRLFEGFNEKLVSIFGNNGNIIISTSGFHPCVAFPILHASTTRTIMDYHGLSIYLPIYLSTSTYLNLYLFIYI